MESVLVQDRKKMLNKVPEVTMYFWVIKVLCTTVGETAADYLNVSLNLGLAATSVITGALLVVALILQFKARKYIPGFYWLSVFLISIFGTLVTDNLTDGLGVALEASTVVFGVLLAATFAVWSAKEKTLSIHSIFTRQREAFYWLAILFTFALGTAAGDLMAESLGLGYLVTGMIVAGTILAVTIAWRLGFDPIPAFWIAYILTRPLGASIGDYLSQTPANGGLGMGPTMTTLLFASAILLTVAYLSITKRDQLTEAMALAHEKVEQGRRGQLFWQTAGAVTVLLVLGVGGYFMRQTQLRHRNPVAFSATCHLGDLSRFMKIGEDTLRLAEAGKLAEAKTRVGDLEFAWDNAEARLKPRNPKEWSEVDGAIDQVLRQLRAFHQNAAACKSSLQTLLQILGSLGGRK